MLIGIKAYYLVSPLYQNEVTGDVMLGIVQLLFRTRQRQQSDAFPVHPALSEGPPQSGH